MEQEKIRPGKQTLTLKVGEWERRAIVHVPRSYDGHRTVLLVLVFHGAGGTAKWTIAETGWCEKAEQEGFLVALPEGIAADPTKPQLFPVNPQLWDDGSARWMVGTRDIDDVAFVRALLDELERRYTVDRRRVYVSGFSMGGGLAFRLGAVLSSRIAAIAPVATNCWLKEPKPARGVPTLYMVGTEDPLVPLEGGEVKSPFGGTHYKPPVRETLHVWAKALGCPAEPTMRQDKEGVKIDVYGPGKDGTEFIVYTITGLGHHWPGGKGLLNPRIAGKPSDKVKATDVIWEFFQKHRLP